MKHAVVFAALAVLLAGCASSTQSTGPEVGIHLNQVNMPTDVFYFSGPVNVQYLLTVTNTTKEPITLSRLDLSTVGPGAYSLRASSTPIKLHLAPGESKSVTISAWGYARGGYTAADEPVTLQGTAYFDAANGGFVRIFNENISPR